MKSINLSFYCPSWKSCSWSDCSLSYLTTHLPPLPNQPVKGQIYATAQINRLGKMKVACEMTPLPATRRVRQPSNSNVVEYNGWFRRIIRVKDVRVISKTANWRSDRLSSQTSTRDSGKWPVYHPNDASSFSNHQITSQPSKTNSTTFTLEKERQTCHPLKQSESSYVQFEKQFEILKISFHFFRHFAKNNV